MNIGGSTFSSLAAISDSTAFFILCTSKSAMHRLCSKTRVKDYLRFDSQMNMWTLTQGRQQNINSSVIEGAEVQQWRHRIWTSSIQFTVRVECTDFQPQRRPRKNYVGKGRKERMWRADKRVDRSWRAEEVLLLMHTGKEKKKNTVLAGQNCVNRKHPTCWTSARYLQAGLDCLGILVCIWSEHSSEFSNVIDINVSVLSTNRKSDMFPLTWEKKAQPIYLKFTYNGGLRGKTTIVTL